ncbi:alanine racemase [Sphingomonas jinjuensis]|uniref:alanine racemase n=1 Tax=Sphingomonas jinjuensis TaxID=535907 RepID=A0A840FC16_9SPHN|nr:alanine racemase [Sphingomonas jinjuensis]MBB4153786.1 alanine racemase [Sphingomonas jinjuensis]
MPSLPLPLRLHLDGDALAGNWRALDRLAGSAACGAAVKADGYGLGAVEVAGRLAKAGCRDFFVATWAEAAALAPLGLSVSVLHGVRAADLTAALAVPARPVLSTETQVARWRDAGGGVCDVMVDTGMNRLGVSPDAVRAGLLGGLAIDTLMSHLACADDEDAAGMAMNEAQRSAFAGLAGVTTARRMSLANSAGVALGAGYAFGLVRPGLALYGGIPRGSLAGDIRQVVFPHAEILQRRTVPAAATVGYNATWRAARDTEVAIINLGYADGYFRGFSDRGGAQAGGTRLPVIGRVSMDLVALDVSAAAFLAEGDWVAIDFALPAAAAASGMSQYELLTSLGHRYARDWD